MMVIPMSEEYYADIRVKVKANSIYEVLPKLDHLIDLIMNEDEIEEHFIKAVGLSLSYRDMMVGDSG